MWAVWLVGLVGLVWLLGIGLTQRRLPSLLLSSGHAPVYSDIRLIRVFRGFRAVGAVRNGQR